MRLAFAGAVLAALLAVSAARELNARELGIQGRVWPIVEIDMRELLIASAARADLSRVGKELRESAERYLDNLPKRTLRRAERTETRWIDPSFVLTEDIRAPIKNAQGDWQWGILYRKGTRFNPLSVQRPYNALFFFNGTVKEEAEFAAALIRQYPATLMLVEASGANPEKLALEFGAPVFSATDAMLARFRIQATPALLYPGEGPQSLMLGLTELAPPYSVAQVEQAWPSVRMPNPGGSH